jgi:hypothetical protein
MARVDDAALAFGRDEMVADIRDDIAKPGIEGDRLAGTLIRQELGNA